MYFRDVLLKNKLLQHSKLSKHKEESKKKKGKQEILWILFLTGSTLHENSYPWSVCSFWQMCYLPPHRAPLPCQSRSTLQKKLPKKWLIQKLARHTRKHSEKSWQLLCKRSLHSEVTISFVVLLPEALLQMTNWETYKPKFRNYVIIKTSTAE